MTNWRNGFALNKSYLAPCAIALVSASLFTAFFDMRGLPGIGAIPLLPITLFAACLGLPLLLVIQDSGVGNPSLSRTTLRGALGLFILGAALALFPIMIDVFFRFPRNLNVPLPAGLLFYPAIALVAEVSFHLAPLALLVALLPRGAPLPFLFAPVVFVEPLVQSIWATGPDIQSWLVFGNVSLISAAQLWLFWKYGFGAMIVLRISFYLFLHLIWGTARLSVLY